MTEKSILILEDDQRLALALEKDFTDHGYHVTLADQIKKIPSQNFQYAIIDLRLSHGDFGLDVIDLLKSKSPEIQIVILTGYGSITTAIEAVKRGAVDYLTKPSSFEEIEKALFGERIKKESDYKRRSLSEVEHEYIDFVLTKNEGNISRAAKDLGLHRQSLQRKLKKYL